MYQRSKLRQSLRLVHLAVIPADHACRWGLESAHHVACGMVGCRAPLLSVIVVLLLTVGCGSNLSPSLPPPAPTVAPRAETPTVTPVRSSPSPVGTPGATAAFPTEPATPVSQCAQGVQSLSSAPFPVDATVVAGALPGGGTCAVGPFVFTATLYHDPRITLPAQASQPSFVSDVAGVGVAIQWQYQGAEMPGPIGEGWGPSDNVQEFFRPAMLLPGQRGGRTGGGLLLPKGAIAGDRPWYGLRLATPQGIYGVKVEFSLRAGPQGLEVIDVAVAPFAP